MRSRRSALRFTCNGYPMLFKTAYEDGAGQLQNISTDGCVFNVQDSGVEPGDILLVQVQLGSADEVFEARSEVVRADSSAVAVKFILAEPEAQSRLRHFFRQRLRENS